MNGARWQIQHQCPQCGAPVILDEADRLLACPFCRSRLYIVSSEPFHYHIPAPAAATEVVYIPYWRFRGLSFRIQPLEMTNTYVDTNRLALPLRGMPPSLGVRPQAMKLKFLSPETAGVFLRPARKAEEVIPQTAPAAPTSGRSVFIGDSVSLIYTPMIAGAGVLRDAFRPQQVLPWTEDKSGEYQALASAERDRIRFLATLCPACGWDIQGARDTLVLTCRNCRSAWSCNGPALAQIPCTVMAGNGKDAHYLPFWRLKVRFTGLTLTSLADLIRLANLPKAITPEMLRQEVHFWSPAFKLNPALFTRLARQLTVYQPDFPGGDSLPPQDVYPVTLAATEALESILVTLAGIVTDKRVFFAALPGLQIHPEETLLVYLPFTAGRQELAHEVMKVVIDRKALAFGAFM
jgi:DNA-directed RNA polymerase subunit RPC12/RpoP